MNAMTNHYGYIVFPTALGHCGLAWAGRGIARLQLPGADAGETEKLLLKRFPSSTIAVPDTRTREVIAMRSILPLSNWISPGRNGFFSMFTRLRGRSAGATRRPMAAS